MTMGHLLEALTTGAAGHTYVAMALADTQYTWRVPEGCRDLSFRLADMSTATWRWSTESGRVATPVNGYPMGAGQEFVFETLWPG